MTVHRGSFYEDDEPFEDIQRAWEEGYEVTSVAPRVGWNEQLPLAPVPSDVATSTYGPQVDTEVTRA